MVVYLYNQSMKVKLLILFYFVLLISGKSQNDYTAFKLDNVQWQLMQWNGMPPQSTTTYIYRLCGDTIVKDTTFKKMYLNEYTTPTYNPPGSPPPPNAFSFYGFFRQDSVAKRDYFMGLQDTTSTLLYCYNLQVGDTIGQALYNGSVALGCNKTNTNNLPVLKTDTVIIENKKFKVYLTDTTTSYYSPYYPKKGCYIIEGLGHFFGIFNMYSAPFEGGLNLQSYAFDTVCNNMQLSGIKILLANNFKIYPNPSAGNVTVKNQSQQNIDEVKVYDTLGNLLYTDKPNSASTTFTLSNAGVYFIETRVGVNKSIEKIIISR